MMKFVGFIVLIAAVVGGVFWWRSNSVPQLSPEIAQPEPLVTDVVIQPDAITASSSASTSTPAPAAATQVVIPKKVAVSYDGKSFTPASVTVTEGDIVTFTNVAGGNMWVASASHPSHTTYDNSSRADHCAAGFSGPVPFDQCKASSTYSFTFTKVGSWNYHDHLNASAQGVVTVVAK